MDEKNLLLKFQILKQHAELDEQHGDEAVCEIGFLAQCSRRSSWQVL